MVKKLQQFPPLLHPTRVVGPEPPRHRRSLGTDKPTLTPTRAVDNSHKPRRNDQKAFSKQRDALALSLVQTLDSTVFGGQLPDSLQIVWNRRLNTTAGRASWRK